MKIIIDFRKFDRVIGGVERGVIEITRYLASWGHTVILLPKTSRLSAVQELFQPTPNIQYLPLDVKSHVMSLRNVYVDSFVIQDIARRETADIIHFPYNWSFPFHKARLERGDLSRQQRIPTLLTVHDVIPLTFREAQGRFTNLFLYRPGMRLATRLNDVVVTVSEFSKQDMCSKLGVPLQKVRVINNGLRNPYEPDEATVAQVNKKIGKFVDGKFILYVGGIHERKNVVGLIHAFARFVSQTGFPGKLLVTGNVSGAPYQVKMKAIHDAAVQETGMQDRVIFTGFIPDAELDCLMQQALFLVYPSFYEGFGIPVLEAMQVGTPVITSSTTAMPEVAGNAALLVDPSDINAIAEAMSRLLKDEVLRRELGEKGKQRAKGYTWEKTARQYLGLYTDLVLCPG
jgi:glycosyltransferase involved in cell wall biosynthesis